MLFLSLFACTFFDNPPDLVLQSVELYPAESAVQISLSSITQVPKSSEEHFLQWIVDSCEYLMPTEITVAYDTGMRPFNTTVVEYEEVAATLKDLPNKLTRPLTLVLTTDSLTLNQELILQEDFVSPNKGEISSQRLISAGEKWYNLSHKLYESCSQGYQVPEPRNILMIVDPAVHQSWVLLTIHSLSQAKFDQLEMLVQDPTPRNSTDLSAIPIAGVRDADQRLEKDEQNFSIDSFTDIEIDHQKPWSERIFLQYTVTQNTAGTILPSASKTNSQEIINFASIPKYLGLPSPPTVVLEISHEYPMAVLFDHWNAYGSSDVYCVFLSENPKEAIVSTNLEASSTVSSTLELFDNQMVSVFSYRSPEMFRTTKVLKEDSGVRCASIDAKQILYMR